MAWRKKIKNNWLGVVSVVATLYAAIMVGQTYGWRYSLAVIFIYAFLGLLIYTLNLKGPCTEEGYKLARAAVAETWRARFKEHMKRPKDLARP